MWLSPEEVWQREIAEGSSKLGPNKEDVAAADCFSLTPRGFPETISSDEDAWTYVRTSKRLFVKRQDLTDSSHQVALMRKLFERIRLGGE
jgi:hypothetical protein